MNFGFRPCAKLQIKSGMDSARSLEVESSNSTCRKRQKSSSSEEVSQADLISNLPESIISYILSLLPTKYAVSTSLLSKGWRFRWKDITSFDFDDQLFIYNAEKQNLFGEFIDMVMDNSTGPINKFRLHCSFPPAAPLSECIITTAIDRNVQILVLSADSELCLPGVPEAIYTSGTLQVLKLGGRIPLIPPKVGYLPNLVVLELNNVIYFKSDDLLANLIPRCPVLQSLAIITKIDRFERSPNYKISSPSLKRLQIDADVKYNSGKTKVEIDASALEYLKLHYNRFINVCIKGPISVKEVDLDFPRPPTKVKKVVVPHTLPRFERVIGDHVIADLVQTFDGVEFMKLGRRTMRALKGVPLSASFVRLTKLAVQGIECSRTLIGLIKGCKKLKDIDICGFDSRTDVAEEEYIIDQSDVPGCVVSCLKHVTVRSFGGLEMGMLHFFLKYGLVMERFNPCFNGKKRCDILHKVWEFTRASPTCEILWSVEEPWSFPLFL